MRTQNLVKLLLSNCIGFALLVWSRRKGKYLGIGVLRYGSTFISMYVFLYAQWRNSGESPLRSFKWSTWFSCKLSHICWKYNLHLITKTVSINVCFIYRPVPNIRLRAKAITLFERAWQFGLEKIISRFCSLFLEWEFVLTGNHICMPVQANHCT
jgi:hypothetical protein